jgi:RNA polymerase sigma factor (sigma-70 family)
VEEIEAAVRAVQVGEAAAFGLLVERCGGMVRGIALAVRPDRELAEDVAQETFLEAFRGLHRLREPAAFPGWLRVIAGRQARRLAAVRQEAPVEAAPDRPCPSDDPAAALERREDRRRVRRAVASLGERQRTVAVLHYLQENGQGEIAAALGLPLSTVKKRLHDARRRLKEILAMETDPTLDSAPEMTVGLIRLLEAIDAERVDEVQALLAEQPSLARTILRDRHPRGETLLHRVMPEHFQPEVEARLAMASLLLAAGAAVTVQGWGVHFSEEPPLMSAAHRGHPRMCRLLLSHGADPNAGVPKEWWTGPLCRPIDTGAVHGHAGVVEALIEGGADHSLAHLVLAGLTERARAMLQADPSAANRDADGALPLHHAVNWNYRPEIVDLLLESGADPNGRDGAGRTPVHAALRGWGGQAAVPRLLEAGGEVDVFTAAGLPDLARLEQLLAADPSLAKRTQGDGATALCYAVSAGSTEAVERLLAAGADPDPAAPGNWRGWFADRPLTVAAEKGHLDCLRLMLAAGADPSGAPLPRAAWNGHMEAVAALLDAGADIHSRDSFGNSALDWCVHTDRPELAGLLLGRGYDPATRGAGGQTALHLAAAHDRDRIAALLLQHGAPAGATDDQGQTPAEVAESSGSRRVLALLERR